MRGLVLVYGRTKGERRALLGKLAGPKPVTPVKPRPQQVRMQRRRGGSGQGRKP